MNEILNNLNRRIAKQLKKHCSLALLERILNRDIVENEEGNHIDIRKGLRVEDDVKYDAAKVFHALFVAGGNVIYEKMLIRQMDFNSFFPDEKFQIIRRYWINSVDHGGIPFYDTTEVVEDEIIQRFSFEQRGDYFYVVKVVNDVSYLIEDEQYQDEDSARLRVDLLNSKDEN
jgi:hypothetical protein